MRKTIASFRVRIVTALLAAAAVTVAVSAARLTYTHYTIRQDIGKVDRQIEELAREKQALEQSLASLDDPGVIEREAREKLNLQKEGEHVVILLPSGETQAKKEDQMQASSQPHEASNPEKWWRYFFGNSTNQHE